MLYVTVTLLKLLVWFLMKWIKFRLWPPTNPDSFGCHLQIGNSSILLVASRNSNKRCKMCGTTTGDIRTRDTHTPLNNIEAQWCCRRTNQRFSECFEVYQRDHTRLLGEEHRSETNWKCILNDLQVSKHWAKLIKKSRQRKYRLILLPTWFAACTTTSKP